jgi:hypothetical protein
MIYSGAVAEWLRRGLQNLLRQFESGRRLHVMRYAHIDGPARVLELVDKVDLKSAA